MKRFYKQADVKELGGSWQVTLDERPLKTVGGKQQIVASKELAQAMAAEWNAQGEMLDPKGLIMRDQTDFALDKVAVDPTETIARTLAYGETDTLCYRADPEDALFAQQQSVWEPIITAIEQREGVQFARVSGIVHRAHPDATLPHLEKRLAQMDPFQLAGLHTMASLAASLCIGLEALQPDADAQDLWQAATLEEEWQADLWGRDADAEADRLRKRDDFLGAFRWTQLALS
ncbi:MAG: ATP12 family protein [Erythrobacter sp.]